jgi:1,2-diacylglycerol 3-beta-glucosyltransferase
VERTVTRPAGRHRAAPGSPPANLHGPRKHYGALIVPAVGIVASCASIGVDPTVQILAWFCLFVFMVFGLRHLAFVTAALIWGETDLARRTVLPTPGFEPKVTILVPCHDEEYVVEPLVDALLKIDYPAELLQIICVNDNSTDKTGLLLDDLAEAAKGRLTVMHRTGTGGKSGALNDAAKLATGDIYVVYDADHQPRPDAVQRIVRHFADPQVALVMGQCLIDNVDESRLAYTIALDYLSGYLVNEYGRQAVFNLPAYGGANCAVRRTVLEEMGGWNEQSVTEDTDLTVRALLAGYRTRFDVTAQDMETAAVTPQLFIKQRYRWARGHQQVWRDYRGAVLRSDKITFWEKLETMLFLLVYHTPAVCVLALGLLVVQVFGVGGFTFGSVPLALLLFAGPLLELASGLILARAPRQAAGALVWFLPMFALSMFVATKALIDGLLGREYSWVKTARTKRA